jgi:hypothetical protein
MQAKLGADPNGVIESASRPRKSDRNRYNGLALLWVLARLGFAEEVAPAISVAAGLNQLAPRWAAALMATGTLTLML